MKRNGFNRPLFERIRVIPPVPANPTPPRAVMAANLGEVVPVVVEKGVKAKPGKRTPTVLEQRWMDAIVAYGCIACHVGGFGYSESPAVHHILRGGRRLGHLFTLPLCDPGHHQGGELNFKISRHPWKARFEAKYGTELELLAKLKTELGVFDKAEYTTA